MYYCVSASVSGEIFSRQVHRKACKRVSNRILRRVDGNTPRVAVPARAELLGAFAVSEGNFELDSVGLKLARHLGVVESEGLQEVQRVGGIVVVLALALLGR